MMGNKSFVFRFADVEVREREFSLKKAGKALPVEPKAFRVFLILLRNPQKLITKDELLNGVWGDIAVSDNSLTRSIATLRRLLGDDTRSPHYIETVATVGYRFVCPVEVSEDRADISTEAASGTPPAARDPDSPPVGAQPELVPFASVGDQKGNRRLWIAAGMFAVLLVAAAVSMGPKPLFSRLLNRNSPPVITSIAVVPLDNLSGQSDQDYFADGMTDELITMLAKNSTLRIISRTSVMQYKGVHRPLPEIARELGVDGILEGSVERSGDKVHMTIQLIQAPSDTHVWAESYDRDANDAVSLPREAAQTIAKKLSSAVLQPAPQRYVNPEAHDAYLRGRYIFVSTRNNEEAGKYFKKATELQPDYALGWAGLSWYYRAVGLGYSGASLGDLGPARVFAQAEAAATKAVELDDSLPESHLALGSAIFFGQWNWARAEQEASRAIELNPGFADAYYFRSKMLIALNRHEHAIEAAKKYIELDPFARPYALASTYVDSRQYDAAVNEARARLEIYPQDARLHDTLGQAYRRESLWKEAVQEWEKTALLSGDKESGENLRRHFEKGGYKAMVLWQVGDLKKKSATQYVSPVFLAVLHAELGQREETLSLLEESYRLRYPQLVWIQTDPAFDFLHSDERYRSIIRRVGLPPTY